MEASPQQRTGLYIILEGGEGLGKSTQSDRLVHRLSSMGVETQAVREPGSTPLGEQIRALLLDAALTDTSLLAEFLLFSAARAQLMQQIIQLRQRGVTVVSDRSFLSSLAYQGYGRGLDIEFAEHVTQFIIEPCQPDLIIVFQADYQIGLARRKGRGSTDRFEQEADQFHRRVNHGFLAIAEQHGLPIVNAALSMDEVEDQVWALVEPLLKEEQS